MYTAGTRNTGGTAERLRNTPEYQRNTNGIQRNTSGTPRYNGTIQYEAQL